jgi:hypothetical protein
VIEPVNRSEKDLSPTGQQVLRRTAVPKLDGCSARRPRRLTGRIVVVRAVCGHARGFARDPTNLPGTATRSNQATLTPALLHRLLHSALGGMEMAVSNLENGLGESIWSRRRDSNPRPMLYESIALPLSYVGVSRGGDGEVYQRACGQIECVGRQFNIWCAARAVQRWLAGHGALDFGSRARAGRPPRAARRSR